MDYGNFPDHYHELQVDPAAEPEVIDAAYRRLANKYHPDKPAADPARMVRLNLAKEVLLDPAKRAEYDRHYHEWKRAGASPSSAVDEPIIEVTPLSVEMDATEGKPILLTLKVRHLSGALPKGWFLGVERNGRAVADASLSMNPVDRFPTTVQVSIPPLRAGDYSGSLTLSVQQRAGADS